MLNTVLTVRAHQANSHARKVLLILLMRQETDRSGHSRSLTDTMC